ncbi:DUF1366 domain-containing protein [Streptococcus moroccensis]|uniref:Phage protein n=1 Tax=Streptococcus moroccensis TaxID=1451356 RepID=A0ABT9YS93_9STRE|nr:DUF1366 domain-containing protein [Streptococcus moroccensis]MDQ0221975.1 hypothetical protein [Streptococcus moroccensis]
MAFKVNFNYPKYDDFGKVTGAFIGISDPDTGDNLSANVLGDYRTVGTSEAITAVLDNFYKRNFADKAMAESVVKIDELDAKTKDFAKQIADAVSQITALKDEVMAEIKAETDKNRDIIKLSTLTLNDALAQIDELMELMEEQNNDIIGNAEETDRGGLEHE